MDDQLKTNDLASGDGGLPSPKDVAAADDAANGKQDVENAAQDAQETPGAAPSDAITHPSNVKDENDKSPGNMPDEFEEVRITPSPDQ